ncbi:MAG: ABC transporter permease [Acidobacteriia bacterium]|nr:ABC transporter permease [Terriglobia bacterium]
MNWRLQEAWSRLGSLFRGSAPEQEFEEELSAHLDELIAQYQQQGMSLAEATRTAKRKLGPATQIRELYRDQWRLPALDHLLQDIAFAWRSLRRNRGMALIAIASLALGIGANTAIFSLMNQVFHKPLPVDHPEQLVWLNPQGPAFGNPSGSPLMSYPLYRDIRDRNNVFSHVFGRLLLPAHIGYGGETQRVWAEMVSGNYFQALGLHAHLGRLLEPDDDRTPGAHPVAVVSHRFWTTSLGAERSIIGKRIYVNGHPFTIVGVSGPEYAGLDLNVAPQIRVPVMMKARMTPNWDEMENRRMRWFNVYARLKPGLDMRQARASLQPLYRGLLEQESREPSSEGTSPEQLQGSLELQPGWQPELSNRERVRPVSFLLPGIVGIVLLIACANIANLLLARATSRQQEVSVRLALGATRGRLIRQLLIESLLLSVAGGVAALAMAQWAVTYMLRFTPPEMSTLLSADLDTQVLYFNFVLAAAAGLLFGLAPALGATRPELSSVLKEQSGNLITGGASHGFRKALVVLQVTLSLVLLITAGLFVSSLRNLRNFDPGFPLSNLIMFSIDPKLNGYSPEESRRLQSRLQTRLEMLPGVQGVGYSKFAILGGEYWLNSIAIEGQPTNLGARPNAYICVVSPSYFRATGIGLRQGREFGVGDRGTDYQVAVVNEAFVKRYLPAGKALGQRIGLENTLPRQTPLEIVGVVRDSKYAWVRGEGEALVYLPSLQDRSPSQTTVYVRAANPASLSTTIRRTLRDLDPDLPVYALRTMEEQISVRLAVERFMAAFSTGFGALATALSLVGLYGVMSYITARRYSEVGIRMALGAARMQIIWLVMRQTLGLVTIGSVAGLLLALAISRTLHAALFGLAPHDPVTLAGATLLLAAVAAAAGFIPAWRASRVNPIQALRRD